jgi:hypothetical protein
MMADIAARRRERAIRHEFHYRAGAVFSHYNRIAALNAAHATAHSRILAAMWYCDT